MNTLLAIAVAVLLIAGAVVAIAPAWMDASQVIRSAHSDDMPHPGMPAGTPWPPTTPDVVTCILTQNRLGRAPACAICGRPAMSHRTASQSRRISV